MRPASCLGLWLLALALCGRSADAATFVYVHDYGDSNQVFAFRLGAGGLEPLDGSPFVGPDAPMTPANQCGGQCQTLTYARRAKLLLSTGPNGITPWRVAKDGSLEAVEGAPFGAVSSFHFGVAAAELGGASFAYVVDYGEDDLYGFRIEDDDSLSPLPSVSPLELGDGPLVVVARKRVLAALNTGDTTLSSFRIEDDGALVEAPGSPLAVGEAFAATLDFDPAGRHLYTGDRDSGDAFVFTVDPRSGALAPGAANPADTDLASTGLGFALRRGPRGFALSIEGELQAFRRARGGALLPLGEPSPLGFLPLAQALAGGRRLLAAANNLELRVVRLRAGGGVLPLVEASLGASNVNAVVVVQR
jgi:hypothetical protein